MTVGQAVTHRGHVDRRSDLLHLPSAAFANPAVTLARVLTDTYTGISPADMPGFLAGQAVAVLLAAALIGWLFRPDPTVAGNVVVPREQPHHATRDR